MKNLVKIGKNLNGLHLILIRFIIGGTRSVVTVKVSHIGYNFSFNGSLSLGGGVN